MITLYGIPNCDTVKKARTWLEREGIEHQFHDFRKDGLEASQVQQWLDSLGAETLVNKRSTTWKQLDDNQKAVALSAQAAELIAERPTLIKRPVLATQTDLHVGFKADLYHSLFN
jgi:Spx/MgsR family transcriptional regulator